MSSRSISLLLVLSTSTVLFAQSSPLSADQGQSDHALLERIGQLEKRLSEMEERQRQPLPVGQLLHRDLDTALRFPAFDRPQLLRRLRHLRRSRHVSGLGSPGR